MAGLNSCVRISSLSGAIVRYGGTFKPVKYPQLTSLNAISGELYGSYVTVARHSDLAREESLRLVWLMLGFSSIGGIHWNYLTESRFLTN